MQEPTVPLVVKRGPENAQVELPLIKAQFKKGEKKGADYYTLPPVLVEGDEATTKSNLDRMILFLGPDVTAGIIDRTLSLMSQKISDSSMTYEKFVHEVTGSDGKVTAEEKFRIKDGSVDWKGLVEDFQNLSVTTERLGELKQQLLDLAAQIPKVAFVNPDGSSRSAEAMAECQKIAAEISRVQLAIESKKKQRVDKEEDDAPQQ